MLASAVSDAGVVVDVVVHRRALSSSLQGNVVVDAAAVEAYECGDAEAILSANVAGPRLNMGMASIPSARTLPRNAGQQAEREHPVVDPGFFYVCTPVNPRVTQRVFHYLNIVPFGLHRPSEVFGVVGRHTNLGLVSGVTKDGQYRLVPYPPQQPQPLYLERARCLPQCSYHHDCPATGTIDPSWLRRIRHESRSERAQQATKKFFCQATARQGWGRHRPSNPCSTSVVQRASALVVSGGLTSPQLGVSRPLSRTRQRGMHAVPLGTAPSLPELPTAIAPAAKDPYPAPRPPLEETPTYSSPLAAEFVPLGGHADADDVPSPVMVAATEESREVLCTLAELQLPPTLALHEPVPPLRVGTRVVARRLGCSEVLHMGTVLAVSFDVTYTIHYDADGGIDKGVLHNDVHMLHAGDEGAAQGRQRPRHQCARERGREPCTVRDQVIVEVAQRPQQAVVMAALGSGRYQVAVATAPVPLTEVEACHVLSVVPVLVGAVFAPPHHLTLFRQLDTTGTGHVSWKDMRHFILSWEGFGQPLSFRRLGEIQRDMCICKGSMGPQLLSKIPVQEEGDQLSFQDFEYVLLRAENLL
ncbi:hypothetical protein, conserved (pseudogene) [Leishmania mexicana MHOM/GT/2001/U1103]|uniref:EF-hand domain-containing protein n=1 Tax=Leishmania mexicana (strain MHOM/GT/2001/U1103) TaxID=929439 RepID=E9AM92_LEIMU|nr:hypothetical protein, conserved (pseudogene) [Leishmania mexicana MHOM/GT/2001/U1103]CBZ24047.1 hypothetical protein, conserved (pseudogene) [Leishmania mexicana MHOM/GT/2001/U1103]